MILNQDKKFNKGDLVLVSSDPGSLKRGRSFVGERGVFIKYLSEEDMKKIVEGEDVKIVSDWNYIFSIENQDIVKHNNNWCSVLIDSQLVLSSDRWLDLDGTRRS